MKDGGKRLSGKDATSAKKVAETPALAVRERRARSPTLQSGPVQLAAEGDSTDAADPVKVSSKKRLPLRSEAAGSESGEHDEEDSQSDSDSDDSDDDTDEADEDERKRLKRVDNNAEERADSKALQEDPLYNPEKNVTRGSANRNKRPAAPRALDDASDSDAEAGAGKSRRKRRAAGTPSKNGRQNRRVTRKEKLARNAAASQGSVSPTASTASTQQYQHQPSLAAFDAVLPAAQVS